MKPTPARDFAAVAKIYGTKDPLKIQCYIIWHYVKKLAVFGLPRSEQKKLPDHDQHIEACMHHGTKQRPST